MEKQTFLAIILSFIFLIGYNALVIAPQQKNKSALNKQVIAVNKVTNEIKPAVQLPPSTKSNLPEDIIIIENDLFRIEFTSIYGEIKSIYSKHYNYSSALENFIKFSEDVRLESYSIENNIFNFLYKDKDLLIQKTFETIDKNTLKAKIKYTNLSKMSIQKNVHTELFTINAHNIVKNPDKMRNSMLFEFSVLYDNKVIRRGNAFKFSEKDRKSETKALEWAGWRDRYYFTIVKPEFVVDNYTLIPVDEHALNITINSYEDELTSGEVKAFDFIIYIGPQDLELLKSLGGNVNKIMAFSGVFLLDVIEKFIYQSLLFMHKFIPNWGICIILISLLIYGATYPLTFKSMMSMRKMQELQPKMAELREKYKNNPQTLNAEVVKLYRIHNINPLGGCLPMLLQMPIFISLYQVLWRTHNFQGAKFLWIKDLSEPDRLWMLPYSLPLIGNEFNILPLLMMIVMFFQQKISSKNIVVTDQTQAMQQKMMLFVMPVFIGAIFYKFASGLTLYFTVFYLLSTLTQYKMSNLKKA